MQDELPDMPESASGFTQVPEKSIPRKGVMDRRHFFRIGASKLLGIRSNDDDTSFFLDHSYLQTMSEASLLFFCNSVFGHILHSNGIRSGNQKIRVPNFFETVVQAPLLEEMLYRYLPSLLMDDHDADMGRLLPGANRRKDMHWKAGTVSAACFASQHCFDGYRFVPSLPLQQFLGGLYLWYLVRERGVDHAILAHSSYNACAQVARTLLEAFPKK